MDSVSQAVLGASVAAVVAPVGHRRRALLLGAALGTLPDLDVFIDYGDAVRNFTYHRGFSHSLFVLAPVAVLLWLALRQFWAPARKAQLRWLAAIALALLTHPLLDAHTAYGTQLFWPMTVPPTAWATLFIIDPLYTLPLFIGTLCVAIRPEGKKCFSLLRAGIALSTLYIGWTWLAQTVVEHGARDALVAMDMPDAVIFATPTPLNSLLWRVVVHHENHFLEGFDSLVLDEGQMKFQSIESDIEALDDASDVWAIARLRWFAQNFVSAKIIEDKLVISDLRMGQDPNYVFSHIAAVRGNPHWKQTETKRLPMSWGDRALPETWDRIWNYP